MSGVSWEQVAAFRLSRHHLLRRAPATALVPVVGSMAGAQAQVLSAAQISLGARVRHVRIEDVETVIVDLPTIRPHQLSMTTMKGQTLMIVRIRWVCLWRG